MSSEKIEALKRQRQRTYTRKRSQVPFGIGVLLVVVILLWVIHTHGGRSLQWILGILMGVTLQRSRLCFTAAFRDPILVGSTKVLKAILLALILSTLGFYWIQLQAVGEGVTDPLQLPGQVYPVGIHTILGAVIFGCAMVLAGGCASGTLVRVGEGYAMQLIVLVGFIIGTLLGARHYAFWDHLLIRRAPIIYLPNLLGFREALILQIIVLSCFYYLAHRYDQAHSMIQ